MPIKLKQLTGIISFPLLFTGGLVANFYFIYSLEIEPTIVMGTILVLISAPVFLLERFIPYDRDWNKVRKDIPTDAIYIITNTIISPVFMALFIYLFGKTGTLAGELISFRLWPGLAPLYWQLGASLLIVEFFGYWFHRVSHEYNTIFRRMHRPHHSPRRLYILSSYRIHGCDFILTLFFSFVPLMLLGAGEELMNMTGFIIALHNIFAHANVDFRIGPLNYVFSMAELHRWHHSKIIKEQNSNYGALLIVWDIIFGTRYLPEHRLPTDGLGPGGKDYPEGFMGQLIAPFK